MARVVMLLAVLALTIYTVVDCLNTDEYTVKGMPKQMWVLFIAVFPVVGAGAWFLAGRPTPPPRQPKPRGPIGPDDDPDFLRGL